MLNVPTSLTGTISWTTIFPQLLLVICGTLFSRLSSAGFVFALYLIFLIAIIWICDTHLGRYAKKSKRSKWRSPGPRADEYDSDEEEEDDDDEEEKEDGGAHESEKSRSLGFTVGGKEADINEYATYIQD